jgi:bifunctional DNA-binding transcriptional regulator/antitoxin component of YhaV-PrlF toxin-antitoxin module
MVSETGVRVMQLPPRGQITIPTAFRHRLGLTDGALLQMRLVGQKIEITPLAQPEQQLRQYTEAELAQFLEDDKIDAETASAVRRLMAEDAL